MKKQEKGFTLVELMVVVAISSVVAYGIMSILRVGNTQAQVIGTRATIQESARDGLTHMVQEMRESSPSRITIANNSVTFQVPAALDGSGNIIWSGNITYGLGGAGNTQLIRTDNGGNIRVVANNVQGVTFTPNGAMPTLIRVRLDVERQTIHGRMYTESLTGEAKIRNE